ncbi:MAG: hypothetical protein JWQ38_1335 [Flavipsychrobacter sp.]|nr:hypothetical protein [Flavipsychrobacter sp.]
MKKYLLPAGLFLLLSAHAQGQSDIKSEYKEHVKKAEDLYNTKAYAASAKEYGLAFELLGWKGGINDRYNAARAWSMAKVPDSAFSHLQKIAEKGYYTDVDKISREEDFSALHKDARWQPVIDLVAKNNEDKLPDGWYKAGSKPKSYFMGIDKGAGKKGSDVMTIKSTDKLIDGFGTVMQTFLQEKYLGKRIKMTGYMKTRDVENWAVFWLRIDGKDMNKSLAFDNMMGGENRSIKGTTKWKKYEIVLDVSEKATDIAFGALLNGTGQLWFDNINFEIVDNKTETTGVANKNDRLPQNLNFGK